MTKRVLVELLSKYEDDMEVGIGYPTSDKIKSILKVEDFRYEFEDGYLQDPKAQCAPSNVIVIFVRYK